MAKTAPIRAICEREAMMFHLLRWDDYRITPDRNNVLHTVAGIKSILKSFQVILRLMGEYAQIARRERRSV